MRTLPTIDFAEAKRAVDLIVEKLYSCKKPPWLLSPIRTANSSTSPAWTALRFPRFELP